MTDIIECKAAGLRRLLRPAAKIAMITLIAALLGGSAAWGQAAGSPDPTFGKDGTVTTTFTGAGSPVMLPVGALEQPNGDIVVLSQFDFVNGSGTQIGLTRYTSAGVPDTTFGTKGSTITAFPTFTFGPSWFALESNGEFLVAGTVGGLASGFVDFGLARFTAAGVLDTTFGTDGVVAVQVGTREDGPSAFLLQPNGQILMGGLENSGGKQGPPAALSLARFNSNGTLDTTFGASGVVLASPAPLGGPQALALLSNGDYLAVGASDDKNGTLVEFSSTGVQQTTVTTETVTATSPSALELVPNLFESNGSYLVASLHCEGGSDCRGTDTEVQLFGETGVLNSSFSSTPFGFGGLHNTPQALAVQSNGQVVVGDLVEAASGSNSGGIARLDTNGELDTTFGSGGTLTVANNVTALLIDNNGNIVAIEGTGNDGIVVARYLAN
jgi:uncharacterized delta-60 repeat protein